MTRRATAWMVPGLKMARVLTLRSIAHPLLLVSLAVGAGCLHGRPLPPRDSPAPSEARVAQVFGRLPLYFIENHGQADARVAYYVQGRETSLYFTPEGVTFALTKKRPEGKTRPVAFRPEGGSAADDGGGPERWAVKLEFIGAKPGVAPEGRDQTAAVVSYFKGPRAQWKRTGATVWAASLILSPGLLAAWDLRVTGGRGPPDDRPIQMSGSLVTKSKSNVARVPLLPQVFARRRSRRTRPGGLHRLCISASRFTSAQCPRRCLDEKTRARTGDGG